MAKYTVVEKANPLDRSEAAKFYAQYKSMGRTDSDKLAEKVAKVSPVNPAGLVAAFEALLDVVPDELENGYIVELGRLGSFTISLNSEGSATADEVTAKNISNVRIRFIPSKEFKDRIESMTFDQY